MSVLHKFSSELISRYKMKSLFMTYFFHILITVTLPILMLIFVISLFFINSQKEETGRYIRSAAERNANLIYTLFSQADTYREQVTLSSNVSDLLSNDIFINNVTGSSPVQKVAKEASLFIDYSGNIDYIYLYSPHADYVYSFLSRSGNYLKDFPDSSWYDEFIKRGEQNYIACLPYNGTDYLTFCYAINYPYPRQGILVIKISGNTLAKLLNIKDKSLEGFRITLPGTEEILFDYFYDESKNAMQYTIASADSPVEFSYSSQIGSQPLRFNFNMFLIILSSFGVVVLSILLSITFARKQYLSILSVITSLENPNIQSDMPGTNELYYLMEKTKGIALSNRNLEYQLLEKVTSLKKAQAIALQTQINPHFLFNTLNMISYSIQGEDNRTEAVSLISRLSDILRYVLKTEEYLVTLKEEVEMLKSYVEIAEIKHDHSFSFALEISQELYDLHTLKSIIQPLVENAVEHGIKKLYRKKTGKITVSAFCRQDRLSICVTDNGAGMSKEALEELKSYLDSDSLFLNKNIGLKNVISRIRLLFDNKGGYTITSGPDGTSVTVYHPVI